jgi:hypothetical protein
LTIRKLAWGEPGGRVLSLPVLLSFNNTLPQKLKIRREKLSISTA